MTAVSEWVTVVIEVHVRIVSCIIFIVATLSSVGASASGAQDCATVVEVLKVEDGTPKQTFAARVLLSKKTSGHSADCNSLLGEQTVTLDAPVDGLATGQRLSLNAHVWSDAMAGGGEIQVLTDNLAPLYGRPPDAKLPG